MLKGLLMVRQGSRELDKLIWCQSRLELGSYKWYQSDGESISGQKRLGSISRICVMCAEQRGCCVLKWG